MIAGQRSESWDLWSEFCNLSSVIWDLWSDICNLQARKKRCFFHVSAFFYIWRYYFDHVRFIIERGYWSREVYSYAGMVFGNVIQVSTDFQILQSTISGFFRWSSFLHSSITSLYFLKKAEIQDTFISFNKAP